MAKPPRPISIDGVSDQAILTIPAKRPAKPVCIRKLMDYVKAASDGEQEDD